MNLLKANIHPTVLLLLSFMAVVVVGCLDFFSGSEISPLLLYFIPIFFISLHTNSNKKNIVIITICSTIVWFLAENYTKQYSSPLILIWNTFVRFVTFTLLGFLLFLLTQRYKKVVLLNNKLNQLNQEKNKFIGVAAHDLKNPIGSITSLATMLLEDYKDNLNEEVVEIAGYIKTLSTNSFHILTNLLDVSKIESGSVEIKKEYNDYLAFIKEHVFFNQLIANKKNITIKTKFDSSDLYFKFDANHLSEVVNNLLTNAIKFSEKNKEIYVIVQSSDNKIRTTIKDEGNGIAESEFNKLFNYFQKTTTVPTDGELSTGLGLAIAKKIVVQHGGTIGFESKVGVGSSFYFDLFK